MIKKSLIILSLIFILGFVSFVYAQNESDVNRLEDNIETALNSGDISQVYTKGRLLLGILSWLRGGECGDNVCGDYEFACLEDCGKLVAKNGFFGGDTYSGESSYDNINYNFEIDGVCEDIEGVSGMQAVEGGIINQMNVIVKYNNKEEIFQVKDKEEFSLENGASFYINSAQCKAIGYVDIISLNSICNDGACWFGEMGTCPNDCGGYVRAKFYYDNGEFKSLNDGFEYNNYKYKIEVLFVNSYNPDNFKDGIKSFHYRITYFPVDNPLLKTVEEFLTCDDPEAYKKIQKGLEEGYIDEYFAKEFSLLLNNPRIQLTKYTIIQTSPTQSIGFYWINLNGNYYYPRAYNPGPSPFEKNEFLFTLNPIEPDRINQLN